MNRTIPYNICRIQLNELQHQPLVREPDRRYYFSCWWKEVPLGHLFVEQQEGFPSAELHPEIWEAIAPAITFYQKKTGLSADPIKTLFLQKNYTLFNQCLE